MDADTLAQDADLHPPLRDDSARRLASPSARAWPVAPSAAEAIVGELAELASGLVTAHRRGDVELGREVLAKAETTS